MDDQVGVTAGVVADVGVAVDGWPRPTGGGAAATSRPDRGQAALLVVVTATVLLAVMAWGLAATGRIVVDRTRARTAADAAALASLDGGRAAAVEIATLHGAAVVAWIRTGDEVTVVVRLGEVSATARATDAVES